MYIRSVFPHHITMLSKSKLKYIRSLALKKNRKAERVFVAEGPKMVGDLLGHFTCRLIAGLPEWLALHPQATGRETLSVTPEELSQASFLQTPQDVIAIFEQPDYETDYTCPEHELCLALDGIQDPGNLGTIVRLADWFGIEHIYCSEDTVDIFNPKTVQATMGALARVRLHYLPLADFVKQIQEKTPVYGTFLDGENMYARPLSESGLIVMGNEGNGISPELKHLINNRLYIPNYPAGRETSESLNVAMATAIVCAEFRRRTP